MRGLKKLHKPRNNKNNEHISLFGKTSVGGNADTGSLTTTRLRNRLSVPCSGLLMWSVQRSAALLRTWPGCLIHSGLCVVACWCWKPPTPGIRGDTFYLPQAGKLNISFPQIKKKRKKKNQRNPGTRDSRGRRKLRKRLSDPLVSRHQPRVLGKKVGGCLKRNGNRTTVKCSPAWRKRHATKLGGYLEVTRKWVHWFWSSECGLQ